MKFIKRIVRALGKLLGLKQPKSPFSHVISGPQDLTLWRKVKVGTGLHTGAEFYQKLRNNKFTIRGGAEQLLEAPSFTVSSEEREIELVVVSTFQLGFKNGAVRKHVYERAEELGLKPCPPEVGPQLRLQCSDQSAGIWSLIVATLPLPNRSNQERLFRLLLSEDRKFILSAVDGEETIFWPERNYWVFARP